jgi:class 3 adenylate cyclase
MGGASIFLKDPRSSRFVAGGPAEAEQLLGTPLPRLPTPEQENGKDVFFVNFHPRLRTLARRFILDILAQIGISLPGAGRGESGRDQAEYEMALARILRSVRMADRRRGLPNLFWLAHTKDIAEFLKELEQKAPALRRAKYSLHPLLSSLFRRLDQDSRKELEKDRVRLFGSESPIFIEGLLDDGFAYTELSVGDVDFNLFLAANKRYRISAEVFFEIQSILLRETERRVREGDRTLMLRIARHLPNLPKDEHLRQSGLVKIVMNAQVLACLLGDAWGVAPKLQASSVLRAEIERRKPVEVVDAFLDLVTNARRFELIAAARDRIRILSAEEGDLDDKASRGLRFYDFGESAQIQNNALNATVLFLDLSGFTQTSEGQISERDLTRELYAVFDAFIPIIERFGGTVDKFLGDGMMITYGTRQSNPHDALNAVRTAVVCQDELARQREKGGTYFTMRVAIHYGRVYLARFIADEETVQTTVIGRNVNLAGRLSSASKRPIEEDETVDETPRAKAPRASGVQVSVDENGVLFNESIAISRDTLVQIENNFPLVHGEGIIECADEVLRRKIVFRYAGDARFKGVRSSLPVYEVHAQRS